MSHRDTAVAQAQSQMGTEIGVSNWITVDQEMINQFGHTTQDTQWIHMDPDRAARETPFGGTIAHGFLTLSLGSRFVYDCFDVLPGQVMGINYGMDRLRFLTPVRAGDRVRGRFTLTRVEPRGTDQMLRDMALSVEIDGQDKPALVAQWLGLVVFSD